MKTAIYLGKGFEEIEALTVIDILRRAGIEIDMVSISNDVEVTGSHGITVRADKKMKKTKIDEYNMIIFPGGLPGTTNLGNCNELMQAVVKFVNEGKWVAAICAAPSLFGKLGILQGKKACAYPGYEEELKGAQVEYNQVSVDGKIITSRGMGCSIPFALKIVECLVSKELSDKLKEKIIY